LTYKHEHLIPDILVSLNVDLVELGVDRLAGDVRLHLHGHVAWQHWQQESLLKEEVAGSSPGTGTPILLVQGSKNIW